MQEQLRILSDGVWERTRARLDGLTDEELLWQPVPGSWSVRPLAAGTWISDWAMPAPATPPFTTIGWRMLHLIGCYGSDRNSRWLGVSVDAEPVEAWVVPAPHTADASIALLERAHERWRAVLDAAGDDVLAVLIGPIGGQYGDAPRAGLVIHQLDEVIHHAAEIATLRDLYRAQRMPAHPDPAIAELLTAPSMPDTAAFRRAPAETVVGELAAMGRWDLVEAALAHGLPPDGPPPTALHRAAGLGRVEIVEQLLAAGADRTVRDPQFQVTPAAWADFFGHPAVAARLRVDD
jgi:hypothetical protein